MTATFRPLVTLRDAQPKLFMTQDALHRELGTLEAHDERDWLRVAGGVPLTEADLPPGWAKGEPLWCIWEAYGATSGALFDGGLCASLEEAEREVQLLEGVESPYPARYWHQEVTIIF